MSPKNEKKQLGLGSRRSPKVTFLTHCFLHFRLWILIFVLKLTELLFTQFLKYLRFSSIKMVYIPFLSRIFKTVSIYWPLTVPIRIYGTYRYQGRNNMEINCRKGNILFLRSSYLAPQPFSRQHVLHRQTVPATQGEE
jgi:hypothetical protein